MNKNLDHQLLLLLEKPLLKAMPLPAVVSLAVFVVDVLDECEQNKVVSRYLAKVVELVPWLLFILTS